MKKKKILIITSEFPPQPGGIGNHAYYLGLFLSNNNYSVSVIADQREINNTKEVAFDAQLPFSVQRISLTKPRFLMYFIRVFESLQAFRGADYIIATGKFSLWSVAFNTLFYKRKTMAVIHGTEVNFKFSIVKKAVDMSLKRFKNIVAVSEYTKRLVSHLKRNVKVVPNGIDLSKWQQSNLNKVSLVGDPVLTTVGRVSIRKGQLQVIKLLPELKKKYPNIHYHCMGIPLQADEFLEVAKSLNVDKNVTFHGAVSDRHLKEALLASDVFLMLSTESFSGDVEGFGIAILEANALGVPAIGSKNCGIEDAILNGKSGFLVSGKNVLEIESALKQILDAPEFYKQEAINWANGYSWEDIIKRYINIIEA